MSEARATVPLIYPYGKAGLKGIIKQHPEDFCVTEQLGFPFTDDGEHLYLFVQKRGLTTHQLIESISQVVGIQPRHIGYAGLKDKQAVTRQWLSLHLPGARHAPDIPDTEFYQVQQRQWHDRKLRVGAHRSNLFDIVVRNVSGDASSLQTTLQSIQQYGFANYFGEQRFGRQDNVAQALRTLNQRHKKKRLSRSRKSLYLSALRSELFNRILSKRIEQGIWDAPAEGDLYLLNGSQSIFNAALDDEIVQRYRQQDIHCAISLFGTGETRLQGQAADLEDVVLTGCGDIRDTLLSCEIKRSYRANRALAHQLRIEVEASQLKLQVELNKGVYLTSLLGHFVDTSEDVESFPAQA